MSKAAYWDAATNLSVGNGKIEIPETAVMESASVKKTLGPPAIDAVERDGRAEAH